MPKLNPRLKSLDDLFAAEELQPYPVTDSEQTLAYRISTVEK